MGKGKKWLQYYKNCKVKFCGLENPFNQCNQRKNGANSFAKQKDAIKRNKILSQKSNIFIDERKTCPTMPFRDRVTEKFVKEGQKKGKKRNFNLNDEQQLTHNGIPLKDNTSNNEYSGANGAQFNGSSSEPSSRKHNEVINELISNSKRQKLERNLEKDAYNSALEKVDEAWKRVQFLCPKNKSSDACKSETKDSYDISKHELIFEQKKSAVGERCQNSATESHTLKVLFDIKDFNLDTFVENSTNNELLNDIVQDLYFLAKKNNLDTAHKILEIFDEEYEVYLYYQKRNAKGHFPRCQAAVLFNIIGKVYCKTDDRHPVVTPALIFMSDILGSEFFFSFSNISTRLYVCNVVLDYLSETKKYMPEAIYFFQTVLKLALPGAIKGNKDAARPKPFNLVIRKKVNMSPDEIPVLILHPRDKTLTKESKKIAVLSLLRCLISQFAHLYKDYEVFTMIFEPCLNICTKLPLHLYPAEMEASFKELIEFLGRETPPLRQLQFKPVKPKPLKMLEPVFECKYPPIEELERELNGEDVGKHSRMMHKRNISKQQKRLKSVQQKIRKEERGLLREIRKTAKAAAAVKLEEKRELDEERKKKTTKIYSELAVQEGEFKKMMRKK